jgi:glc operon protein GlcG
MITRTSIGTTEAQRAIAAGVAMATERSQPMAFAVVDNVGALIACLRMDGAPARILTHALRKAYTAAEMGRDTAEFGRNLRERGGSLGQWGNDGLTTLPGGCTVFCRGEVVGAVACGGSPSEVDELIAAAMARAIAPDAQGPAGPRIDKA